MMHSLGRFIRLEYIRLGLDYLMEKHNGTIPFSQDELLKIPGVGPYISGAVRVFGFDLRDTIIDTNVVRVFGRIYGLEVNPETRRKKGFIKLAETHVPQKQFVEYSYGILDFAAAVCKTPKPLCLSCPISYLCSYNTVN